MKISKPSPAMVVASLALFVGLGGTSIAAINYASNAGKVDGRSAVSSKASLKKAAGKLVATQKSGPDRGTIPNKFIEGAPYAFSFSQYPVVNDNAAGAPAALGTFDDFGSVTATCNDQSNQPGVEDPTTTVAINASANANISKRIGGGNGTVGAIGAGTSQSITINGSNTFEFQLESNGKNLLIQGVSRQDGRGTGDARCLVYGTVIRVTR